MRIVLFLLLSCSCLAAQADAYRCETIENGKRVIEYAQLPIEGYECTVMGRTPPPVQDPEEELRKLKDKAGLDQADDESTTDAATKRLVQRAEHCETAKTNLELLQGKSDVLRTDQNGKKVLLSEEERAKELEAAREYIEIYCES